MSKKNARTKRAHAKRLAAAATAVPTVKAPNRSTKPAMDAAVGTMRAHKNHNQRKF